MPQTNQNYLFCFWLLRKQCHWSQNTILYEGGTIVKSNFCGPLSYLITDTKLKQSNIRSVY